MAPDLGRAEALRAGVRLEALRRAADSSRALMGVGPIAAVSLVLLVAGPSPATRIGFVAFEIATVLLAVLALTLLLRHLDEPATRGRRTAVAIGALVLASLPWPLALVMLVPRDEVSSYLVLIFAIGAAAASLTASAAYAPFYLALVLGNLGPATILIAAGRVPPVPAGLAVMSVVYLALLCVSFLLLNRTLIDAIGGRLVEARLSAELTEANARLEYRATHDELTGLANRALFRERLREMLEDRSARDSVAVLYLDVDRFKVLNDSLGHVEGDALLQLVTERLSRAVRDTDLLARLGGDEFTVVAPGIDIDGALALAERLRAAFDEPFAIGGLSTAVSASIGVAMSRPGLTDVDLMRYADAALYAAKGAGRNRVSLFDDTTRALLSTRLERETTMRKRSARAPVRGVVPAHRRSAHAPDRGGRGAGPMAPPAPRHPGARAVPSAHGRGRAGARPRCGDRPTGTSVPAIRGDAHPAVLPGVRERERRTGAARRDHRAVPLRCRSPTGHPCPVWASRSPSARS
jgi:diguanylate cyclase (GGDEF)-like protein